MLEKHATPLAMKVLPWDDIFDVAMMAEPESEENDAKPEPEQKAPAQSKPAEKAPEADLDDPCDDCGAEMRKGQTKCTRCGAKYADDAPAQAAAPKEEPKAPPPPPSGDAVYDADVPF